MSFSGVHRPWKETYCTSLPRFRILLVWQTIRGEPHVLTGLGRAQRRSELFGVSNVVNWCQGGGARTRSPSLFRFGVPGP